MQPPGGATLTRKVTRFIPPSQVRETLPVTSNVELKAVQFGHAAASFWSLAERLDDVAWREHAEGDGRSLGTIVHHVAVGHAIGFMRIVAACSGYPQLLQVGTTAERNAKHAQASYEPKREATLGLLAAGAAAVEAAIRGADEGPLDAEVSIGSTRMTLGSLIDAAIDHVQSTRRRSAPLSRERDWADRLRALRRGGRSGVSPPEGAQAR